MDEEKKQDFLEQFRSAKETLNKVQEKKEEEKPSPPPAEVKRDEPKPDIKPEPMRILSDKDSYVYERMQSQPVSLDKVDVKVLEKQAPDKHRLSLPDEMLDLEKKYTFKWLFKNKRAIDDACDRKGWVLANKSYFPNLPNHLFTVTGAIERGDNILAFMPKAKAEELRKVPLDKANEIMRNTMARHKDNPNYYTPKDEESEGDDNKVIGI